VEFRVEQSVLKISTHLADYRKKYSSFATALYLKRIIGRKTTMGETAIIIGIDFGTTVGFNPPDLR